MMSINEMKKRIGELMLRNLLFQDVDVRGLTEAEKDEIVDDTLEYVCFLMEKRRRAYAVTQKTQ